jgi:serine/threonine-protein kinase RsbW
MAAPDGAVRRELGVDDADGDLDGGLSFSSTGEGAGAWGEIGDLSDVVGGIGGVGEDEALTPEEFEAQTLSAFGEAFNNIAIHGYRAAPGDVEIEIESDEEGIVIRLIDTGSSFDPGCVAVPDMANLPESGMGLFIINSFMDEVDYRPGKPNILRLAKRRDGRTRLGDGPGDGDDGGARGAAHAAGAA